MHQGSEGTEKMVGSSAAAGSLLTRLQARIAAILVTLRNGWCGWRAAREVEAREAVLRQQLRELDARLLDDVGIPASRILEPPSGSAMARAIDIKIRERMQRQPSEGPITTVADDDSDVVAAEPPLSTPAAPESLAGARESLQAKQPSGASVLSYRNDLRNDRSAADERSGEVGSCTRYPGTIRAAG